MKSLFLQSTAAGWANAAVLAITLTPAVHAQESAYFTKPGVEQLLIGKDVEFTDPQKGKIVWNIKSSGYIFGNIQANGFVGKGAWSIRDDGGFCVKWQTPTPDFCHYFYKDGDQYRRVTRKPEDSAPDAGMKSHGKEVLIQ